MCSSSCRRGGLLRSLRGGGSSSVGRSRRSLWDPALRREVSCPYRIGTADTIRDAAKAALVLHRGVASTDTTAAVGYVGVAMNGKAIFGSLIEIASATRYYGVAHSRRLRSRRRIGPDQFRNLVDPASSHMLVSKIKPCMSKYKPLHGETANGSLKQLSSP